MSAICIQQEWEAYVVEIQDDSFVANLTDITAGDTYESVEAIIPFDAITDHDGDNVEIGCIFRWKIGYEKSKKGSRRQTSQIVFDDSRITVADIQAGKEWARRMATALNP